VNQSLFATDNGKLRHIFSGFGFQSPSV